MPEKVTTVEDTTDIYNKLNSLNSSASYAQTQLDRIHNRLSSLEDTSNNQYWYSIWKLVAISFMMFVATIGGCTSFSKHKVAEMVTRGENPIAARCAFPSEGDTAVCLTYIHNIKK